MTDQEKHSIKLTEQCFLHFEFCADCELCGEDYETCQKSHREFFEMVKASIAERDALRADIDAVCAGKFVDICCICGRYTPDHPSEKCELKGLTCKWVWRGVQKEGG